MAYRGGQDPGLPELDSQRRLREALAPVAEPGVKGMKWGSKKGGAEGGGEAGSSKKAKNWLNDKLSDAIRNAPGERIPTVGAVSGELASGLAQKFNMPLGKANKVVKNWAKKEGKNIRRRAEYHAIRFGGDF